MAIFGAQGIRDAMVKSYRKHLRDLEGQQLPDGTSLHQAALYGALATRYIAGLRSLPETVLWAELAPFLQLQPEAGVNALTEYIVYKEMPAEADVGMLSAQINEGLSRLDDEERESLVMLGSANAFSWTNLMA